MSAAPNLDQCPPAHAQDFAILREIDVLATQLVPVVDQLQNLVPDLWEQFEHIHNRQHYLTHILRQAR